MKPKFSDKKLKLSKKTIADLNNSELNKIYGGVTVVDTCESECHTCLTVCQTKCATNCFSCDYTYCRTC